MKGINIDDKIRDYFLGRLPEAESERFEEELALDETLFADAGTVERELIDDYIRESLSRPDRDSFEENYLRTDARRERLYLARGLWKIASERAAEPVVIDTTRRSLWQAVMNWKVLVPVAAVGLMLIALSYTGIKTPVPVDVSVAPDGQESVNSNDSNIRVALMESENANARPSPTSTVQTGQDNRIEIELPARPEKASPRIATFTLVPGSLRDDGEQSIHLEPKTNTVQLYLSRPSSAPKYAIYSAALKNADGDTIFQISRLKALRLNIPSSRLQNRTYVLYLEGKNLNGRTEPVAEYTFRVRR